VLPHCLTSLGPVCVHGVTNGEINSTYDSLANELGVCTQHPMSLAQ
jgi:hypothetical protein